ncbi:hypothetical protein B0H16DRAFT_1459897 [Mycena metata]|uniref:Uncharacterized protein n=1 Tax=Mycena metata TaxID=1033252 RepID=A0AAD7IXA0_9AGAR|nr:hypothetical protein B0H16DRAFT_1459897 [Mycena metata]
MAEQYRGYFDRKRQENTQGNALHSYLTASKKLEWQLVLHAKPEYEAEAVHRIQAGEYQYASTPQCGVNAEATDSRGSRDSIEVDLEPTVTRRSTGVCATRGVRVAPRELSSTSRCAIFLMSESVLANSDVQLIACELKVPQGARIHEPASSLRASGPVAVSRVVQYLGFKYIPVENLSQKRDIKEMESSNIASKAGRPLQSQIGGAVLLPCKVWVYPISDFAGVGFDFDLGSS